MKWNWLWVGAATTLVMGPWDYGMAQVGPGYHAQGAGACPQSHHGPVSYAGDYCEECEEEDCCCSPIHKLHNCCKYIFTLGGKTGHCQARIPRDPRQLDYTYLYRYRAPRDLRYPAANQPAGVVVYPYYTVKGPDDFFLQETLTD